MVQAAKTKASGKKTKAAVAPVIPIRSRKKPKASPPEKPPALSKEALAAAPEARLVGDKVLIKPLDLVKPNAWNPNRMTPFQRESLKVGLLSDGWLISQSLLIWGTDDKGVEKNIIIDGEQRWTVATANGFTKGAG